MRKAHIQQLPLAEATPDHPKAKELAKISEILDQNSSIYDLVLQDIGTAGAETGAHGMTAEQVLRAAIIKQIEGFSYRALAFHLMDSRVYSWFCRIGIAGKPFKKSTLQHCINAITDSTWEQINHVLLDYGRSEDIEQGRKIRVDCTVVESNIHAPFDSQLLVDSVRVLARILTTVKTELPDLVFSFSDHGCRAKRRGLGIMNAKNSAERKKMYKDLLLVTENTIGYAERCLKAFRSYHPATLEQGGVMSMAKKQLEHFLPLTRQVVCQTRRRVLEGESVPAAEKIVSIFEEHTDIIRKDRRDTYYGHKICLTGGASNLILDCVILEGNPADSSLTEMMLDRQKIIYDRYPLKSSFDGGFSSQENLKKAKEKEGVKDVCFSKGRGLKIKDMCRSNWMYKQLRNFRAGIESGISWLKRSLGLDRCLWKGFESFKKYVWASIVSANLLTMARHQLA